MTNVKKPPLKNAADILTLIGTILATLSAIFGIGFFALIWIMDADVYGYKYHGWPYEYGFGSYYDWLVIAIIGGLVVLFTVVFLVLAWVAYHQTAKNSKGWAIYGLVQAIFSGAVISIVGYVLALVHLNLDTEPAVETAGADENIKLASQLAAAKAELEALKAAKAFRESQQGQPKTVQAKPVAAQQHADVSQPVSSVYEAPVSEESILAEEAKQAE